MLAHGFLHLLAWDHDTPEKERAMWERQDRIRESLAGVLGASSPPVSSSPSSSMIKEGR
jgi:hypothetical protein